MEKNTLEKVPGFRDVELERKLNELEKKLDRILEAVTAIKEKVYNA